MKRLLIALGLGVVPVFANANIERICGYSVDREGITFNVVSNGCTGKGDFNIKQWGITTSKQKLELVRNREDICEVVSHSKEIKFTWSELELEECTELVITNPALVLRAG